jgi:hypothetical protein
MASTAFTEDCKTEAVLRLSEAEHRLSATLEPAD